MKKGSKCLVGIPNKHDLLLLQVELFAEAIHTKALNAGWQSLTQEQMAIPDAYQLFVSAV